MTTSQERRTGRIRKSARESYVNTLFRLDRLGGTKESHKGGVGQIDLKLVVQFGEGEKKRRGKETVGLRSRKGGGITQFTHKGGALRTSEYEGNIAEGKSGERGKLDPHVGNALKQKGKGSLNNID